VAKLASTQYLSVHSLPQEDRYDTDDASAREIYPILVPTSTMCPVQSSRWWRRTRCLSWRRTRHRGRIWLLVSLYNFVMPHKSLRQGRQARTPAMAIGLTDHVWSYRAYLWLPVHAAPVLTQQMNERVAQLLIPAVTESNVR